jgi:hypothetical protein
VFYTRWIHGTAWTKYNTNRTSTHPPHHPQAVATPTSSSWTATATAAPPSPAGRTGITGKRDGFDAARTWRRHTAMDRIFDEQGILAMAAGEMQARVPP